MSNQLQITGGAKVRALEGVITGTSGVLSSVPLGAANGVATLDSGGKVPVSQLPSSVVTYLGTWNAATNTPTLTNGVGDAGDMYICNVAGTVNFGAGPVTFAVGDWVLYGSGTWQKSNGQNGTVTSVGATITGGAIGITGSPITTAGTLAFAFAGTSGQYVNGAGNLTTFPSLTGFVPYTGATNDLNLGTKNLYANNAFTGFSSITASGTQVVLTVASVPTYLISGSGGQTIKLPDATTLPNGANYVFNNNQSSGAILVNNNSNTLVVSIPSGGYCTLELTDNSIAAGSWDRHFEAPSNVSWSTNTLDYSGSITSATWNGNVVAINRGGTGSSTQNFVDLTTTQTIGGAKTFSSSLTASSLIKTGGTSSQFLKADGSVDSSSYITLASLSATSPLSYNNTTGAFSIQVANTSQSGYLSSTDWNTFNSKQSTLTFSSPLVNTSGTVSIPAATSSVNGYLTSTDWATFNNKQATITLTTTGTSGAATLIGATLNIPNYAPDLSGYVTLATNQTISGVKTFSANPSINTGGQSSLSILSSTGNSALILAYVNSVLKGTIDISATEFKFVSGINSTLKFQASGLGIASLIFDNTTNYSYTFPSATGTIALVGGSGVGTVTSVGLSAPTGFSVTGSPVTSSGTLALAFASGYSLPTNVKQSNWDDAYTWVAAFPTQTGNNGKYLTTNGSVLSWADNPLGTVTSVAMTVPTGLSVSGSPITSSGTLAVTLTAGYSIPTTASQTNWDSAYTNRITSATSPLSITSNVISISQATTSTSGYLSSTDWTTFNNKQAALTNPVTYTGTPTTNYLPKFTGTSTIGNSILQDDGTNVSIGYTTNPSLYKLDVNGTGRFSGVLNVFSTGSTQLFLKSTGGGSNRDWQFQTNETAAGDISLLQSTTAGGSTYSRIFNLSPTGAATFSSTLGIGGVVATDYGIYRQLVVYGGSTGGGISIASSGTATGVLAWANGTTGTSTYKGYIEYQHANDIMAFATSASQKMILDASGRLEIGYATNQGAYKLDVNGTGRFSGTTSFTNGTAGIILGSPSISGVNLNFSYYSSSAASRTWNIRNDQSVYGDFAIQQSTTQSGTSFANVLYFGATGAATFSSTIKTAGFGSTTARTWKLGELVTATVIGVNTTGYITIEVNGSQYNLALANLA